MIGRVTEKNHRRKIAFIFGLFFCFIALIIYRLWCLQLMDYSYFNRIAKGEHTRDEFYEPRRGWIYDRNGKPLATSIVVDALIASPKDIYIQKKEAEDKKESKKKNLDVNLSRDLAILLGKPQGDIFAELTRDTTCAWLPLSLELTEDQSIKMDVLQKKYHLINELRKEKYSKRVYPKGDEACHILGPVGVGSMDTSVGGWGTHKPLGGLESVYQKTVAGSYSTISSLKDGSGRDMSPIDDDQLMNLSGDQIYLTIDENIQRVAEEELASTVDFFGARAGYVVVMDPNNGEILAMANYPKFNLAEYRKVPRDQWRDVSVNRAVEYAFEPGSTFKIFPAAAVLDQGKVKVTDTFNGYHGKIEFAGRILRDSHPYGMLTFPQIIEVSSNIGIYQVAQRISTATLYDYIKAFGFGKPTGIELPGESSGVVQPVSAWNTLVASRVSFGQSISVNAIQLASAVSAIANGGILLKPHIVKAITDEKGQVCKQVKPEPVRRVIREETAKTMRDIMEGVVIRGTGKGAAIANCRVAGKTGTAQICEEGGRGYVSGKYLASFIGFLPVENPQLVVGVFIAEPSKNGHFGGTVSTPAFKKISQAAMGQLKIHPRIPDPGQMVVTKAQQSAPMDGMPEDDFASELTPVGFDGGTKNSNEVQTLSISSTQKMPELKGLTKRIALVRLAGKGLVVEWKGSGIVVDQSPKPGMNFNPGDKCYVILGSHYKPTIIPKQDAALYQSKR